MAKRKTKRTRTTARKKKTSVKAKGRTSSSSKKKGSKTARVTAKAKRVAPATKVAKPTAKPTARKSTTTHRPPSHRSHTTGSDFDFNKWLLPTLDLEQYEPQIIEEVGVKDQIRGSTRYAWIGAGQCGGRVAKAFFDLGYKKVVAVNTTHHDLDLLEIPQEQKFLMDIGEKGAGKDMQRGKEAVEQYGQEILHKVRQTFGNQVDHIMVCFGAGGGTGGGSAQGLIEIAKRYARYIGLDAPDKKVGAIMTLPTIGEASSPQVAQNAHDIACELSELAARGKISPLIIVDNEKINKLYPGMTVKSFWSSINNTVAGLFDIFNRVSNLSTRYTSFDPVDYNSIVQAGGCTIMGLTRVNKFGDKFAISQAMKRNLEKTLLASGFNLSTAHVAGCIVVGGKKLMAEVKGLQDNINYAFDVLSEITGKATIHRGIYEDDRNSLRVYTIIGGLNAPATRLEELLSCVSVHAR
jgi:cell division GTPase FtsZ